jgi:hypothetical protein
MVIYTCLRVEDSVNLKVSGYKDVTLGLLGGNGSTNIIVKGTCADFQLAKDYVISIHEAVGV